MDEMLEAEAERLITTMWSGDVAETCPLAWAAFTQSEAWQEQVTHAAKQFAKGLDVRTIHTSLLAFVIAAMEFGTLLPGAKSDA